MRCCDLDEVIEGIAGFTLVERDPRCGFFPRRFGGDDLDSLPGDLDIVPQPSDVMAYVPTAGARYVVPLGRVDDRERWALRAMLEQCDSLINGSSC